MHRKYRQSGFQDTENFSNEGKKAKVNLKRTENPAHVHSFFHKGKK